MHEGTLRVGLLYVRKKYLFNREQSQIGVIARVRPLFHGSYERLILAYGIYRTRSRRQNKRGNGRYYRIRVRVFPRFKNQESNLCSMFWSKPVNVPAVVYEQVI